MKLDDSRHDDIRFPSSAKREQGAGAPVVVQVQLTAPVQPAAEPPAGVANFLFRGPEDVDLSGFHDTLEKYGLLKAEHSFREISRPPENVSSPKERARDAEKQKLVDLHFPAETDTKAILSELRALPQVERAIVKPKAIPPQAFPTDPLVGTSDIVSRSPATGFENQWYLFRCHADQAWALTSGKNVIIADIDFGFRVTHQDLAPNLDLAKAHNAMDGSNNVSVGPYVNHGTAVLGLAAAASNAKGMAGFAFNATLWPIQASDGTNLAFASAIDWATNVNTAGKRLVINLEAQTSYYGNYESDMAVNLAIRNAIAKGIIVCVTAGNGSMDAGHDNEGNPIQETGSIVVGATSYDPTQNVRASFTNYGPRVVVSAPGDQDHDLTCSDSTDDAYLNGFGGTSGATPKVSGTVALMLEANPSLTPADVKKILIKTGDSLPVPDGNMIGVFLNTAAAVQEAIALKPPSAVLVPEGSGVGTK